jgi:hypothetical protein
MDVLDPFPIGSQQRFLWALLFLKSTNGVADKVSCGHFCNVIKHHPVLTMEIHKNPLKIASILRQTSKWVKNTVSYMNKCRTTIPNHHLTFPKKFVIVHILSHISEDLNGSIPQDFDSWLNFHEIGPKTASLLFHAAFGKQSTLPTDSHVWYAFTKMKWTNATTEDECSWQATLWMDPNYFVKTNDCIGSVRQILACSLRRRLLFRDLKHEKNKRLCELINLLDPRKKRI